jgi:protein gp37
MSAQSKIEWTDATWNPTVGCSLVSPGCTNCYAMKLAGRLEAMGNPIYRGHTTKTKSGHVWNGKVSLSNWGQVIKPLTWRGPRRIFVNSMSDIFHESLPDDAIDRVFAVMALCPQHIFQVLTKRPARMRKYMNASDRRDAIQIHIWEISKHRTDYACWPLPNFWAGTSVEDQARADERIPELLATPAALRFLSIEPLLGPVDISPFLFSVGACAIYDRDHWIDWLIVGGESGPGARPMHPDWARALRDQCKAAGVPFFFKQWGAWAPTRPEDQKPPAGTKCHEWNGGNCSWRVGKKAAGRLLDGIEHSEFPARPA